jgi:hypothetical protein
LLKGRGRGRVKKKKVRVELTYYEQNKATIGTFLFKKLKVT